MNVYDMAQRGDANLVMHAPLVEGSRPLGRLRRVADLLARRKSCIRLSKRRVAGRLYRGLEMSGRASFTLRSALRWYPFRALPHYSGWEAALLPWSLGGAALELSLIRSDGVALLRDRTELSSRLAAIALPKPFGWAHERASLDLRVSVEASVATTVFLAVHEVLERKQLISLCRGRGVELGPGPNPQIRPSPGVDVRYVEQASAEQWETLYNAQGKFSVDRSLWDRYQRGGAYPLPVPDASLDFLFASHVFEHLANPIGHLEHWRTKLRAGGLIAAVVPDMAGSKDYVFEPTPLAELEEERRAGYMEPQLRHFERWASVRAPGRDPRSFMEAQRSIHAHFYTHGNMQELLELACRQIGFARYDLRQVPNHKDFYFVLWK